MNTKLIFSLGIIYLIVFGAVFLYLYDSKTTNEEESSLSWSHIKSSFKSVFKQVYSDVSNVTIPLPNISSGNDSLKRIYGKGCVVDQPGFHCDQDVFAYNLNDKSMLLSFTYKGIDQQEFNGMRVYDGIECSVTANQMVKTAEPFYVKLTNCTFKEKQARFELYYNKAGSSKDFQKKADGMLSIN